MPKQDFIVDIDLNGNEGLNFADPTQPGSASTKRYTENYTNSVIASGGTPNYVSVTAAYTALTTDYTIDANGTFAVTLPTAVGVKGKAYEIKNSGAGNITLTPQAGQTIDGAATLVIATTLSYVVRSDGANWKIISALQNTNVAAGAKGDVQFRGNNPGTFTNDTSGFFNYNITQQSLTIGPAGTNLSNNPCSVNGNVNNFVQSNVQNTNNGTSASSDLVGTADNGNDNKNFIDAGINSSGFTDPTFSIAAALDAYLYCNGGSLAIGTETAAKIIKFFTGGTLAANERVQINDTQLLAKGQIVSNGGGVGYATGAGGTVTQATSRATGVTLNKLCGTITMFSAAVAAQGVSTFTLTNSFIAATDLIIIQHSSATNGGAWNVSCVPAAGSVQITVRNVSNASITEATPLRFAIIKTVTA